RVHPRIRHDGMALPRGRVGGAPARPALLGRVPEAARSARGDGSGRLRKLALSTVTLAALLACAMAAAYARALDVGFFSDDITWLARMDATRAHPSYLLAIFGRDFTPLFHLSLLVDFLIAGAEPWMFHASSIAVHCGCALLLVELLRRLGSTTPVAALIAATWA